MAYVTRFRQGELFVPDKEGEEIREIASLFYGRGVQGYDEHPYLVFLKDLKKIESMRLPLIYVQIDDTAKARRIFTGGLEIERITSGLTPYEQQKGVKLTSTFSRKEYEELKQFFPEDEN